MSEQISHITIKEVAKKAGVSIATVSRYLNNPSSLRDKNRKQVETAVKELNYQPLIYARRLAGGKLNIYSLIIPGYEGVFYSFYAMEIMRSVAAALDSKSIDLHLHVFWNKDNFKNSLVDGVIFADVIGNHAQLKRVALEGVPVVVMNRRVDDLDVSYVAIDNFKGAYDAVEFLIKHGHKKIVHLAGDLRVQAAQDRVEGYKSVMQKHNLEMKDEYAAVCNFSRKEARAKLEKLFANKENAPSAVFCCSDEVAMEVLAFAEEKHIEVPKRLSVIGFDDNPNCATSHLMLTTVRQPLQKMAQSAVNILHESVEKKIPAKKIILETELIVRDTVTFL